MPRRMRVTYPPGRWGKHRESGDGLARAAAPRGAWSWYQQTRFPSILAGDVKMVLGSDDVPFWAIPTRGCAEGPYRDDMLTTAQAEVRWHTPGRLGAAGFGGFGQVAPSLGELASAQVLWGGGAGVRIQLTKEYPMHRGSTTRGGRRSCYPTSPWGRRFRGLET
jgi:hypothetical protein